MEGRDPPRRRAEEARTGGRFAVVCETKLFSTSARMLTEKDELRKYTGRVVVVHLIEGTPSARR